MAKQKISKTIKAYLSHAIRGRAGAKATLKMITTNCEKAIKIGTEIRAYFYDWEKMDGLPKLELYIPAESEPFVNRAYVKKYLSEKQILDIDCDIVGAGNLLLVYGEVYGGVKTEVDYAVRNEIPVFIFDAFDMIVARQLRTFYLNVLKEMGR